ncbi:MAG: adenylosuccinate lyase [Sporolactobacillus sp.]
MSSHFIDYQILGDDFGTAEMRTIWSEKNRIQKQLDVEAALAKTEARMEIIPEEAAKRIAATAFVSRLNMEKIREETAKSGHSLFGTIKALQIAAGESGEYVHYGVTTQDIVDTGQVLQIKESLDWILPEINAIIEQLIIISEFYKDTEMAGRTHGMQAIPITFGFKLARYLDEYVRHYQRLNENRSSVLTGNISGAVGTYASLGLIGIDVEKGTLAELGLNTPTVSWQSSPDRIVEYAHILALISATTGKIAHEFFTLMRDEINELEEPFQLGKIGSSTMPHKRNPALLEGIASLTQPVYHAEALIENALVVDGERDAISLRSEWIGLPEIHIYLSYQLKSILKIFKGLVVKPGNMKKNLAIHSELLFSEKVLFLLSSRIGKQTAHQIVYQAAMESIETGASFQRLIEDQEEVKKYFSEEQLRQAFQLGTIFEPIYKKIENVIERAKRVLQ